MEKVFKVGLIGCGHIAETYFRAHKYFKNFKIVKCADKINSVAKYCAKTYSIENVSVSEILKDKDIQVILNLTTPNSHYIIAKKSLLNGKHVYSEKPLAVSYNNGKELVNIARRKKLYLGNAPDTFLGGGNQKAREILEKQIIGKIKFGTAVFAFPGIQSYHPNPEPWFAKKGGGPVIDMGPYYLTALVNLLGPAKDVISISSKDNKNEPELWVDFQNRYTELIESRFNTDSMRVKKLVNHQKSNDFYLKILIDLSLSISDEGYYRLKTTLLNL